MNALLADISEDPMSDITQGWRYVVWHIITIGLMLASAMLTGFALTETSYLLTQTPHWALLFFPAFLIIRKFYPDIWKSAPPYLLENFICICYLIGYRLALPLLSTAPN